MAILQDHSILLKDIQDGVGSTIKWLMMTPGMNCGSNVLFSRDGQTILFGGEKDDQELIKLWRPLDDGGDSLITVKVDADADQHCVSIIKKLALSHDGTRLVSTSNLTQNARLWAIDKDTGGLNLEAILKGNVGDFISGVSFTPDDKYVVVGTGSEELYPIGMRFLRIEDGICTKSKNTNGDVSTLNYSPDGRRLLIQDDWGVFVDSGDPESEDESEEDENNDKERHQNLLEFERQRAAFEKNYDDERMMYW